jgi:5'(3')-deoxyribonucleotidase
MPFTIALDLDNTTADFTKGFASHLHATSVFKDTRFPEHNTYDLVAAGWFSSKEEFMTHFQEAERNGLYRSLTPFNAAIATISALQANGDVVNVVTARSDAFAADTLTWLEAYGLSPNKVIHTDAKHEVEADLFIEDADYQIENLTKYGRNVIVHSRPYNTALDVPRFDAWVEAPELINDFR